MGAGAERVDGIVLYGIAVDAQAKGIGISDGAAVVVDNRLDHLQRRRDVVVGDGASLGLAQRQSDAAVGGAVAAPTAGLVAGQTHLGHGVGAGRDRVGDIVGYGIAVDAQAKGISYNFV